MIIRLSIVTKIENSMLSRMGTSKLQWNAIGDVHYPRLIYSSFYLKKKQFLYYFCSNFSFFSQYKYTLNINNNVNKKNIEYSFKCITIHHCYCYIFLFSILVNDIYLCKYIRGYLNKTWDLDVITQCIVRNYLTRN